MAFGASYPLCLFFFISNSEFVYQDCFSLPFCQAFICSFQTSTTQFELPCKVIGCFFLLYSFCAFLFSYHNSLWNYFWVKHTQFWMLFLAFPNSRINFILNIQEASLSSFLSRKAHKTPSTQWWLFPGSLVFLHLDSASWSKTLWVLSPSALDIVLQ